MKRLLNILILILINSIFLIQCMEEENSNQAYSHEVHVVGTTYNRSGRSIPRYWLNGKKSKFPETEKSAVSCINVSGPDVYVTGFDNRKSCYWKNGELEMLETPEGTYHSAGESIIEYHGEIFIAGWYKNDNGEFPCYWMNGMRIDLVETSIFNGNHGYLKYGQANTVMMSDNVLYTGGRVNGKPCYWINEQRTELHNERGSVNSIFVQGKNIYTAGYLRNSDGSLKPVCWINKEIIELPAKFNNMGIAKGIFISGSNVYVAGQYYGNILSDQEDPDSCESEVNCLMYDLKKPCYWIITLTGENSMEIKLSTKDNSNWGDAVSIKIIDNVVYIAGCTKNKDRTYIPCYWVNGTRSDLPQPDSTIYGYANSIFVRSK